MVARIWHGWTTKQNADVYENLLLHEVFPSIEKMQISGYRKISLLKRDLDHEVEFITIMLFDDLNAVKAFAGEDFTRSYVIPKARKVLLRHDRYSQHYEIRSEIEYK